MARVIYVLCAITSLACAALLFRAWRQSRARVLLWSALCFVGLFLNNLLVIVDLSVLTRIDLGVVRLLPAAAGLALLVFGLIWEVR